jgi:pyrroloquinoline quinone (PQQ) biosynthesis protein C
MSATNFAVEGPTGQWTKRVMDGFEKYSGVAGLEINDRTTTWVSAHADYDDMHPHEALEIIKSYATSAEEQRRVRQAAKRAMEYYSMALDSCLHLDN